MIMSFLEAGAKEGSQPHGDDREALGNGEEQELEGTQSGDFLKRNQHKHIFQRKDRQTKL